MFTLLIAIASAGFSIAKKAKARFPAGLVAHAINKQEQAARQRYLAKNPPPKPLDNPWRLWSIVAPNTQAGWLYHHIKTTPDL